MTATDCPFCSPRIDTRKEPIYFETDRWRVTDNQTLYDGAERHLLILPKKHVIRLHDLGDNTPSVIFQQLSLDAWKELYTVVLPEIINLFEGEGTLLMRLGDFETTGSTVEHLHLHWIVPEAGQTVYAHMGPRKWRSEEWQDLKKT